MRLIKYLTLLVFLSFSFLYAQEESSDTSESSVSENINEEEDVPSQLLANFGVTVIDGETFYLFNFQPDLAFGQFGIGLDFTFHFNTDGEFRTDEWDNQSWRRVIRYLRWGRKGSKPVYARLGQIDSALLGNGFILYNYNNSPSIDDRRIGLAFDLDLGKGGIETLYSDFKDAGILGARGFLRPLKFTSWGEFPIIGGLEIGATFVGDLNENSGILNATYNETTQETVITERASKTSIAGFDLGLPLVYNSVVQWKLYYDYAKILEFGQGHAIGTSFRFNLLRIIVTTIKLERRFLGDKFLPNFFDQFYELQRYTPSDQGFISKARYLQDITSINGTFGELSFYILKVFKIIGAYQDFDGDNIGGNLHLETKLPELGGFEISAGYDRQDIQTGSDLFRLDENSLLYAQLLYRPIQYLHFGIKYFWNFVPVAGGFETQKRVEPTFGFGIQF